MPRSYRNISMYEKENKTVPFRSALELIKLMDEAMVEIVDIEGGAHENKLEKS